MLALVEIDDVGDEFTSAQLLSCIAFFLVPGSARGRVNTLFTLAAVAVRIVVVADITKSRRVWRRVQRHRSHWGETAGYGITKE